MNQMVGKRNLDVLNDISAKKLLDKIGKGNHIPGSGSAAALQCMVSAQLTKTVLHLTLDEKRVHHYVNYRVEFEGMLRSLEDDILPNLETLFYDDSEQFNKVISSRMKRDSTTAVRDKSILSENAKNELKESINIPIKIAEASIEVARISSFLFERAFHAVRGDSGVALSGSIAALEGSLAIIDLNFLSIDHDHWKKQKINSVRVLREKSKELKILRDKLLAKLENESLKRNELDSSLKTIVNKIKSFDKISDLELEKQTQQIQRLLWEYQDVYFPRSEVKVIGFLSPEKMLKQLGFVVSQEESLGTEGIGSDRFEVAGIIDNIHKTVQISKYFASDIRNFTMAHELGHAILHDQDKMHRDRQTDGTLYKRPKEEREADKFASYFLMPGKYVKMTFKQRFKSDKLVLNEDVLHFLGIRLSESKKKFKTIRDFSRYVAELKFYGGGSFTSMNQYFDVSIEAMAIRLEELNLVDI